MFPPSVSSARRRMEEEEREMGDKTDGKKDDKKEEGKKDDEKEKGKEPGGIKCFEVRRLRWNHLLDHLHTN